jgi:cell division protein FtsB
MKKANRGTTGWLVVQLAEAERANRELAMQVRKQSREIKDLTSARDYLADFAQRVHRERRKAAREASK